MKKAILTLSLILVYVIGTTAVAQDKKVGIRAGYQSSFLSDDGNKVGGSKSGFYAGAYRDTKVFPFLRFSTGIEYSQLGTSNLDNGDYALNYVGIPLGIKAQVGPVFASAGSGFNIKVAESGNPYSNSAKWYDIPAYVGAGINILFVTVEAKQIWGLTNINNGLNNNSFQLGLSMRF